MRIRHDSAIVLEAIVRKVYRCDRGGMGGYIDADNYEENPFDAALIALAPLWERCEPHEIDDFLFKWDCAFRRNEGEQVDEIAFIKELGDLVDMLLDR